MYEWENELTKDQIATRIDVVKKEIKRIMDVTLRGNFTNQEDRNYWVDRLKKLNCQLNVLENY